MNTANIKRALQGLSARSVGCYAADRIPFNLSLPAAFVANTHPNYKPGEHWVAVYINNDGDGTFFDSYGEPPTVEHHRHRLRRWCRRITYNKKRLQSLESEVCGEYCVMFLHHMCSGGDLQSFCSFFTGDTYRNDDIVATFYRELSREKRRKITRVDTFPRDSSLGTGLQACVSQVAHL